MLLQRYRQEHVEALRWVQEVISDAVGGVAQTSRIKTIQTLHDKLQRQPTKLSRMQDIAGVRIVNDMSRLEQDTIVGDLRRAFPGARVQDRRDHPSFGYRAVHVLVKHGRCTVEIQVRTRAQDLWAQIVERLGDVWGRQIRHGGGPDDSERDIGGVTRQRLWDIVQEWSNVVADIETTITEEGTERQHDPADLKRKMHEGLANLARFVDAVEGL